TTYGVMPLLRTLLRLVLGKRLPITAGDLRVPGLSAPVTIRRDKHGIPMIEAANEPDALFALGFCHAQDRAAQLEVLVRLGRGTISELVGPRALAADRVSRRVGFRHAADRQWPVLTDRARDLLSAYTAGINAGYTHGLPRLPHEFVALRATPTPWEPQDVLAYTKIQSWFMASNWDVELARLRILMADGPEALQALDPVEPALIPYGTRGDALLVRVLDRLQEDLNALLEVLPRGGGSNNWVIAPSRTTTGRPILCNDPHLGAQLPAPWYLVSIRTPDWSVAGASFVGSPSVPCGHNGHAAWGVTAGLADNTDLFVEELRRDGDAWQYRQGDTWLPCTVRREVIRVKGAEPVTEEVLSTSRGPIINPVLNDTPEAISLRAVWLDPLPLDGWLSAMRAKSFAEFREPFRHWPGFPMNLVYADTSDQIGWLLAGQVPLRKRGNGLLPLAGWDDRNGWEPDLVPFERMPSVEDPPAGFFATANSTPVQSPDGPFLGADFLDPYRHQVIVEDLAARDKWDLVGAAAIQLSVRSIPWREVRDTVLEITDDRPAVRESLARLRDWDAQVSADSPDATVFELFLAAMAVRVAKARAPKSWEWAAGKGTNGLNAYNFFGFRRTAHLVALMNRQPAGWFPEGWPRAMADALDEAVQAACRAGGTFFPWGQVRPLTLRHQLIGQSPLRPVFNLGPVSFGGDENTPCHASVLPLDPLGPVRSFPNLRAAIDVGAWSNSRFALAGGQSGNPYSPHYADLFGPWQRGEGVPIAFTPEEVRAATVTELRLASTNAD
ncbi:MAG: penicillin acylase family protein, partial [Zavarzinella sp.]|nr:penicillin acylase family protein [Zavarzinella sp.]